MPVRDSSQLLARRGWPPMLMVPTTILPAPIPLLGADVLERSAEATDSGIANTDSVRQAEDELLRSTNILEAWRKSSVCYSMNGLEGLTCLPYRDRLSGDLNRYEVCSDRSQRSGRRISGEYFKMDSPIPLLLDGDAVVVAMAAKLLLGCTPAPAVDIRATMEPIERMTMIQTTRRIVRGRRLGRRQGMTRLRG